MYLVWKQRKLRESTWCWCSRSHLKRRYSLIPFVVRSERIDGRPRQVHVARLPAIRTCCMGDEREWDDWWQRVQEVLRGLQRRKDITGAFRKEVLHKLKAKVPKPRKKRTKRRSGPRRRSWSAWDSFSWQWFFHDEWSRRWRDPGEGGVARVSSLASHLQVLGLTWPCTVDQVKGSFRALAKKHHPDMGGDAANFRKVYEAYERVLSACGVAQ